MLWHVLQLLLSNDCHVLQYTSRSLGGPLKKQRNIHMVHFLWGQLALHAKIIMMIAILQHKYVQFAFGIYLWQVHAYVPVVPHYSLPLSQVQQLSIIRAVCRV